MADANNNEQTKPSRIKRAARFMFDVPSWVGSESWSGAFGWIAGMVGKLLRSALNVNKTNHVETFEEAMQRLNVSEQDLQEQLARYTKYAWGFLALSVLAILYVAFIWHGSLFFSKIMGIAVVLISLSQAVRFSFWSFQIKRRQLGGTFKQWFSWLMRGQA